MKSMKILFNIVVTLVEHQIFLLKIIFCIIFKYITLIHSKSMPRLWLRDVSILLDTEGWILKCKVHLNFRAGLTFPVPVCTVPSSMDSTSRCNKVYTVRLYASYRLSLLLLKGQRCVFNTNT